MKQNKFIPNDLSKKILMVGIKRDAPGGMAAGGKNLRHIF